MNEGSSGMRSCSEDNRLVEGLSGTIYCSVEGTQETEGILGGDGDAVFDPHSDLTVNWVDRVRDRARRGEEGSRKILVERTK